MRKRIQSMPPESLIAPESVEPKFIGVWIDQTKAQFITVQGDNVNSSTLVSPKEACEELARKRFYRQVVDQIGDAEELLIAGPSELREELRREFIRHAPLSRRLAEVHLDESPTPRQWRARTKKLFEGRPRVRLASSGTVIAG